MKFQLKIILLITSFLLASCAVTYPISSDYEKAIDFSNFKTFQILKQKNGFPMGANPINKQRIDRAILKEMSAINFDTSNQSDLLVSWFVKVKTVQNINVYHDYYGQWRRRNWGEVYNYKEGTLIIDIIDKENKQVVWHGTTSGRVYDDMPNVEEKINKAVNALLQKFAKDAKLSKSFTSN